MKQLTLLRHAEAVPPSQEHIDSERPLTARGITQCQALAQRFASLQFDKVMVSSALRTRETARLALPDRAELDIKPDLYDASASWLAELAKSLPHHCNKALIVAHNPGISVFANRLGDGSLDEMTTACAISFIVDGDWADLQNSCLLDWQFRP